MQTLKYWYKLNFFFSVFPRTSGTAYRKSKMLCVWKQENWGFSSIISLVGNDLGMETNDWVHVQIVSGHVIYHKNGFMS